MSEPVSPAGPALPGSPDEEFDLARVEKCQDKWVAAGCAEVLDVAQEVYETCQGRSISSELLPAARNKTKVFVPTDVDYAVRALGASVEQHGTGPGRFVLAALVPLGPAFVDADAVPVVHIDAPLTEFTAEAVDKMLGTPGKKPEREKGLSELVAEICHDPWTYADVLGTTGIDISTSDRVRHGGEAVAPRDVAPHTIAGLASRPQMYTERDMVVSTRRGSASRLDVFEFKSTDPRLFSTQQLSRGYHATLAEEPGQRALASGGVHCWHVGLASRTAPGTAALRMYHVEFTGPDALFDRHVTAAYELHLHH